MAKTTFIDGNEIQGIQGTRLRADFLNKVFNHRHSGQDDDGHAPLDYAVATGSSNAYAVDLNPPLPALIPGMPITFRANHTNTGPATLNINGLGAKSIRRINQNLAPNQILNGQIVTVMYDGTYFQMVSIFGDMITHADINTDNTAGNATQQHHGFMPKLSGNAANFINGLGQWVSAQVTESGLNFTDITTGNATSARHGLLPKLTSSPTDYFKGSGAWGKISLSDTGVAVGYRGISTSSQSDIAITTGFRPSVIFFMAPVHSGTWACLSIGVSNASTNHCAFMTIGANHYEVDEDFASCFYIRNPAGDGMRSGAVISRSSTGFTVRQSPGGLLLSTNLIYCALP